jgi:hypothetical protein
MNSDILLNRLKKCKELGAQISVQSALQELDSSESEYGVVKNDEGQLVALVQKETLRSEENAQSSLNSVIATKPVPFVIGADTNLDKVVQEFASDFAANPNLEGILVKENEDLKGVLPRRLIVKRALEIVATRGVDRLEGAPLDTVYYECTIDNERKSIDYYDPKNPPKCRNGHKMKLVED